MNDIPGLVWMVVFMLLCLNEYSIQKNLVIRAGAGKGRGTISAAMALVKTCILFLGWSLHVPLTLVYVLLFCGYIMSFWPMAKRQRLHFYLWTNFFVLSFMAVNLICFAAVSLITGRMLRDVYYDDASCLLILCVTLIIVNLINLFWLNKTVAQRIVMLTGDEKRFKQLVYFEWYAVGYLVFDSIPCIYMLPYPLLSVFLIGSCILLLIQFLLFLAHTYRIIEKIHCETEYYRLEEKRADCVKRQMTLKNLAYIDSLTGTFTRRYAMEILESMRRDALDVTVAYIDVNGLKKINDTFGHPEGDKYLKTIANSLNVSLNKSDILSRIGGDEFLIISNSADREAMEALLAHVNEALKTEGREDFRPSFSFGAVCALHNEAFDLEALLRESDRRMYEYKLEFRKGGGR